MIPSYVRPAPHRLHFPRWWAGVVLIDAFVILLAGLSAWQGHRLYQSRAEITTQNLAHALVSTLDNAIHRVDVSLRALRDIRAHGHLDDAALDQQIERIRARLPEVDAIRLTDAHGLLTHGSQVDRRARISLADRPHFIRLRDQPELQLVISQPQVSRVNNKWVIVLARRLEDSQGEFAGMIFAAITLESFTQAFARLDLGPRGVVFLRDDQMRFIVRHPDLGATGPAIGERVLSPEAESLIAAGQTSGTFFTRASPDKIARTLTYRKIDEYPLHAFVGLAADDYLADWRKETFRLALIVTLFLLASLYAARKALLAWRREQAANARLLGQEALYHELVEDAPVLVVRYRPDTTIDFANTAFAAFFGLTSRELQGRRWLDFIPEPDQAAVLARIAALSAEAPVRTDSQLRVLGQDGQSHWMRWTDRAFFDADGALSHLQSIGEDVTAQKRAGDIQGARLRLMEYGADHPLHELLVATLDEASALTESRIGFYHFLEADQKTLSLQAWSTQTLRDYCRAEGAGRHYDIDEAGVWVEAIRQRRPVVHNDYATLEDKRGLPPGHAELIREMVVPVQRKGLIVAILGVGNKATPYTDADLQAISQLADLAWDFAEAKRLEAELHAMATTDPLTGLGNRRHFILRMNQELARLKRFELPRAATLMLDLDHFKAVNDGHGHAIGDAMLKHFATLVGTELRSVDFAGRLGGEEFAILLLGADLAAAGQVAERLRHQVATSPLRVEGQEITMTVSIGITVLAPTDASVEAALSRADAALYEAKRGGRNRVCAQV